MSQQSMMKAAIFIGFVALAGVVLARPDGTYTDKYDGFNVPETLGNNKLRHAYVDCVMGDGRCTPEAKELKAHLEEAIQTDCAKCTAIQRERSREVIAFLIKHDPASWSKLQAKFDPTGEHTARHQKELEKVAA